MTAHLPLLALVLSPLLSPPLAGAQNPAPAQGDGILVVAPRSEMPATTSGAKMQIITAEQLARTGERSLPRAIGRAAGLWVQESNLGGGSIIIRGLLGNQVLVMIDGVRINDSTTRFGPNQSLNTIDPAIVERVEIIRGSSSLLYGSDAIGGVIAIWTKRRPPARDRGPTGFGGSLRALYDSATEGGSLALEADHASANWGLLGVASGADWDDLKAGGGEVQDSTGYHSAAGFASAEWALDPARTLRLTTMLHRDFEVPRTFQVVPGYGQTDPSFAQYDFALQEHALAILTYDDVEQGGLSDHFQARVYARQYNEQRIRRRLGSAKQTFGDTSVDTLGLGLDWVRDFEGPHRLTWGLDLSNDNVDSFDVATDLNTGVETRGDGDFAPNARYSTLGAFVQDEIELGALTDLTLGLRFSQYDFAFDASGGGRETGNFNNFTASSEMSRQLSDSVTVTATLAQGFQAPNLEDLANDGDFAGGTEIANPDLDPAKSLMGELALDVVERGWSGSAAAFYTRIDDYIGRRLLSAGAPGVAGDETYLRSNAGSVDLWGIELSSRRDLGRAGTPWSAEATASWVRGRQHDDTIDPNTGTAPLDGVEARRIPPVNGRVGLLWRDAERSMEWLDEGQLDFIWALDQEQLHPEDMSDPRIDPNGTAGWFTWNLEFGGPLSKTSRWSVMLVNLLDENYRVHSSAIDGPGRSVVVTVQVDL